MSPIPLPFDYQETIPCGEEEDSYNTGSDQWKPYKRSKSDLSSRNKHLHILPPSTPPSVELPVSITTFNILAPIYKRIGTEDCRESQFHDTWFKRNADIIDMLLSKDSFIICLQEFWLGNKELVHLYEESLRCAGYDTFKLARTRERGDGLLTAIKRDRLTILNCKDLLFNDYGDRVAQLFHVRVKVPFFKRNQIAEQQLLLVNTHLLFPHDSSFCLVRLWQVYKILECVEQFKAELGLASVPVILCGDWNGSKRGHVYKFLRLQGFVSCYDSAHSYGDNDVHRWVSHRNHRGNICGVDFVWLRNPSNNLLSLSTSWRQAVLGIIMAKIQDAGLSWRDVLACAKTKGKGSMLSLYDLQVGLHQLGLTGRRAESLMSKEIRQLMQQSIVDMNTLLDDAVKLEVIQPTAVNISNKTLRNPSSGARVTQELVLGLAVEDAALFPPQVEQGLWPEDYILSDHAPLTVTLRPKRAYD